MKDQGVQQVQRHVEHRHGQHGRDQQPAFAGDLQKGNQDQRAHGRRSAQHEAGQIAGGVVKQLLRVGGPQDPGDGVLKQQDRRHKNQGNDQRQRGGGGIASVGFLLGAVPQGSAAGHLDARGQHAANRPDPKQHGVGKLVRGDGVDAQEAVDHHVVNQKAQGNRQRG